MWEAFCALHPYALHFKRCEIQNWLVDRHINCIHIDPQTGTQTNMLKVMVDKCKRYCERLTRANGIDGSIRHNYEGKLLAVCLKHNFKETARRMGHSLFTSDTPYILPGWSADKDENLAAGGYCILVSTMNLALNHARAQHWSAGNVSMAIDHTYKMDSHGHPHICINVIAPDQSAHRLAFGMVSHANEKQTTYALDIVLQHCRHVFDFHRHHNLNI